MDYVGHLAALMAIYGLLACSLGLLVGQAGIFSVAHAAFFGIGAYTSALLVALLGVPVVVAMLAAMIVSSTFSVLLASASVRLRGDDFVLATFAFQIIAHEVMWNWVGLTRGPLGVSGIPAFGVGGWQLTTSIACGAVFILCVVLAAFVFAFVARSPYGRSLRGISEDEALCQSLGINTAGLTISAFAISAAGAGMAGSLFAHYVSYIDPTSFGLFESIAILAMVIIGGSRSTVGALVGAAVFVLCPEILRFVGLPSGLAANVRQMLFGLLLVVVIVVRPRGFVAGAARST